MTASFRRDAESFLRRHAAGALRSWLAAEVAGTWHPNGFAVFHLGDADRLGGMRLHAWPGGRRIVLEGQPAIHSHPWHMCSLVLAGRYEDVIYEVRDVAADAAGGSERLLQRFELALGEPGAGDRVYPLAGWYAPIAVETRTVGPGDAHYMPAGQLHQTTVPSGAFVATLLITGEPHAEVQLYGDGGFGDYTYVRPPVSAADVASIKQRLADVS